MPMGWDGSLGWVHVCIPARNGHFGETMRRPFHAHTRCLYHSILTSDISETSKCQSGSLPKQGGDCCSIGSMTQRCSINGKAPPSGRWPRKALRPDNTALRQHQVGLFPSHVEGLLRLRTANSTYQKPMNVHHQSHPPQDVLRQTFSN